MSDEINVYLTSEEIAVYVEDQQDAANYIKVIVTTEYLVQHASEVILQQSDYSLQADSVQAFYDKFKVLTGEEYAAITPADGVIYYTLPPFS